MASTLSASVEAMPQLNAIGIVVSDMAKSIRFYRVLGVDVPETPEEGHVDVSLPNGVRLMLDKEEVITSFLPEWTRATGNQMSIAFECESAAEVDEVYARVVAAGVHREKEAWGAVLGSPDAEPQGTDWVGVVLFDA